MMKNNMKIPYQGHDTITRSVGRSKWKKIHITNRNLSVSALSYLIVTGVKNGVILTGLLLKTDHYYSHYLPKSVMTQPTSRYCFALIVPHKHSQWNPPSLKLSLVAISNLTSPNQIHSLFIMLAPTSNGTSSTGTSSNSSRPNYFSHYNNALNDSNATLFARKTPTHQSSYFPDAVDPPISLTPSI